LTSSLMERTKSCTRKLQLTSSTPTAQRLTTDRLCAARCLWSMINSLSPRRS
ncbi:hypothetical protein XENORESO_007067, partial [Xenotaenia resolanae]